MNDSAIDSFGWTSSDGLHSCEYITPEVLSILKKLDVKRILDIGCGNGKLCSDLFSEDYQVVGMEYDEEGVAIAKNNYPSVPFYCYGVQDDPSILLSKEDAFDAVVSTEVVEHLFSPHLLPMYAKEVLKDNGYFVITTPYHGYFKNLALSLFNKWDDHLAPLWHGGHIKFWSKRTLIKLLEENGFSVVGFSGVGRIPYLWKSMVIVAQKNVE